jgi:Heparinase II/III-like protein/Heparinase II/III N-terminus
MTGRVNWKDRYQRLRSMSPRELGDRVRQQAMARADWLRYKIGAGFKQKQRSQAGAAPRFFFSVDTIPALCSQLRQRFPSRVEKIVERADRVCQHHFDLLGYENLEYGAEIDWHYDRVHGKRAPLKPWFQIHYLDFTEVGDSKVTWELNRHQHLVTLAKAYRLTGDEKFAAELVNQWRHWQLANPYPMGLNWASSLEVGFRSLSWLWTYFLLSGSPAMTPGFRSEWLQALAVSGRHMECYLSTYFSPNTHLLGEGVALFFIGTLCPELQASKRWQRRGWEIVQQEAGRQVRADGLHFEQSTYYHVYAVDFFLQTIVLASLNDIPVPPEFQRTIERMLNALCLLGRAGPPPRVGDDDGGRLFDPRRNRGEHLLDPLAIGSVLFGRGDFKAVSGGLTEELLWLLGESGASEFDRLPAVRAEHSSAALRDGGLYLMAGADAGQQLVVDSGPQGAHTAGHGHADALNVTINDRGRSLLIDPGTFEYVGQDSERNRFRGTAAHNTLVVDGQDQAVPKGPFSWARLPKVTAEGWINGQTFDLFVGSHDGYGRLPDPVVHRRWTFSLKSRFWLVRDLAVGVGKHRLDLFWHFAPEFSRQGNDSKVFLESGGQTGLCVLAAQEHGWSIEVNEQQWSPVYGRKERCEVLHFGTHATPPAEFVTLLLPLAGAKASDGQLMEVKQSSTEKLVAAYRYRTDHEEHHFFFGQRKPWTFGPWTSDSDFLYQGGTLDGSQATIICCSATQVEFGGLKIVSSTRPVLRCEIIKVGDKIDVVCSDKDAVVNKEALSNISAGLEPAVLSGLSSPGSKS